MNRVVITGQGTINALGFNVASTLKSMENGQSGISIMDFPNIDRLNVKIGGQIKDFDPQIIQQLLSKMSGGMAVALYTTLTGLVTSILLKLQYFWLLNSFFLIIIYKS